MDFSLSDDQRIIQQTARVLFSQECSQDLVKSAWEDPDAAQSLWDVHLSDWVGLSEQPLTDMILFLEEHGRALVPGVFFPSLLARYAAQCIDETLAGTATIAVAGADGYWHPNAGKLKHFVPCAAQVEQLVLVSGSLEKPAIAIVPLAEAQLQLVEHMDELRPMYRVRVDDGVAGRDIDPDAWQQVYFSALLAVSAELIGVARYLLESAIDYAKERQQFGRPIGSFQGLQWKLVDVALAVERAAAAVSFAAMTVDAHAKDGAHAVHSAKLEAGSAARQCARTSLQVHGGIGYTWEQGLHFWLRRAYAADAFMGPADFHARCLAELLFKN